jgi:hydroxymethylglutaryl-CoA synthase
LKIDSSKATIIANSLGDVGAASVLLGLSMALEKAKSGERIMLLSHGPGSGSDAISLIVNDGIREISQRKRKLSDYLNNREYIDYVTYLKLRGMIT